MAETPQKTQSVRASAHTLKEQAEANPAAESAKEVRVEAKKERAAEQKSDEKAKTRAEFQKEKKAAAPSKEKTEKKREVILERTYTVSLLDAYAKPAKKRAGRAVKLLRGFVSRHMHAAEADVRIDNSLNSAINKRGAKKPPKKLRVNASKDKTGAVLVALAK